MRAPPAPPNSRPSGRVGRQVRPHPACAALAALWLAACAGPPPGGGAVGAGQPASTVTKQDSAEEPAAETAARTPETPGLTPADADPKRLIGLDHAAVTALLGAPEFQRKDAPAEFWRYRAEGCTLSLFLYGPEKPAAADKRTRVRHVEARATGDDAVTATECLRALLRARAEKTAS